MGVTDCHGAFVSFNAGTRTPDLPATGHTAGESGTFKDIFEKKQYNKENLTTDGTGEHG